jgi:hypothetical protein
MVKVPVRGRDEYWAQAKLKTLTNASKRVDACMADFGAFAVDNWRPDGGD